MSEKKWTPEKIHHEIYDARTKLFVVAKVLETGSINLGELPEWTLVIKPLLDEVVEFAGQIRSMADQKTDADEKQ